MVVRHRDTHWKIPVEQYVLQLFPLSGNVNFPISVERNVFLIFLNRSFATAMLAFGSASRCGKSIGSVELWGKKEQEKEAAAKASALARQMVTQVAHWIFLSLQQMRDILRDWPGPKSRRTLRTHDIWWKEMGKLTNTDWDLSNEKRYLLYMYLLSGKLFLVAGPLWMVLHGRHRDSYTFICRKPQKDGNVFHHDFSRFYSSITLW